MRWAGEKSSSRFPKLFNRVHTTRTPCTEPFDMFYEQEACSVDVLGLTDRGTDQRLVLQTVVEEENFGGREEFVEESTTVEVYHSTAS